MKFWIFLTVVYISVSSVHGQYTIHDWYGVWEGDLNIIQYRDTVMSLPMSLEVSSTEIDSIHNWIITYAMEGKPVDRREYTLIGLKEKGRFLLDENNGITMPMDLHGNAAYSNFDVMNSRLASCVEIDEDKLIYSIVISSINEELISPADSVTGNPAVYAYPVKSRHHAILSKNK